MIIQGSNNPIYLIFDEDYDLPDGSLSVSLRNEVTEIKHWTYADATIDGLVYALPVTQEESSTWPEGRCVIQGKWLDGNGETLFFRARDEICRWEDGTILSEVEE